MKIRSFGSRLAAIALVCLVGNAGATRITAHDSEGHLSSLRATVTMTDGTSRVITLQGVGCTAGMCSRVRATDVKTESVWLDGLASVRDISHETKGPIKALFTFKDGSERQASIVAGNRVLYVQGQFGRTEKLDLARLTRIDFLN